jgi:hypothetical protein
VADIAHLGATLREVVVPADAGVNPGCNHQARGGREQEMLRDFLG